MFIYTIIGLSSFVYIFRIKLLWLFLKLGYFMYTNLYHIYEKISNQSDKIVLKSVVHLNENDKKVYEYEMIIDNKKHTCCLIHKDNIDKNKIFEDYKEHKKNKTLFLHCNLSHEDEILIDITNILRDFVLHFKTNDLEYDNIKHFLEYLVKLENYSEFFDKNIDKFKNSKLVIYLNDEFFTEKTYDINNLNNKTFTEIVHN